MPILTLPKLFAITCLVLAAAMTAALTAGPPEHVTGSSNAPEDRLREGTKFTGERGHFEFDAAGERAVFHSSSRRLHCLENLCMERIGQSVHASPDRQEWSVTGVVTEYRGSNFLLVTQALLTTRRVPK